MQVHGGSYSGAFETFLTTYSSPSGEAYFDITRSSGILDGAQARNNVLDIRRDLVVVDDKVTGDLVLQINDANANMTKNYRNRLHGALLKYVNDKQSYKLLIEEMPRYPRDIAWDEAFGVSLFAFGIALSGLLFGMLSMTHEWEDRTVVFIKLSPRSTCLFLLAKGISCLLKSFISAAAFMAVYFLLFRQMPTHGDILFLTVFLTAAVFIFLGMLIGHYIKSTITSFLLSMITALTVWIGGGGFGPLSYYGEVTNILGKINPLAYTLEAVRFAFDIGPVMVCLGLTYIFLACLIGLWAESFNGSAVFSMVLAVLLWFLSGATASINYATGILKTVALLIPNSYGLAQIRDIVFSMTMSDLNYTKGWLLMLSYMTVFMVISRYMYGRKLNRHIR